MVGPGTHHDHRAALGLLGVLGELAADAGGRSGRDAGDGLLPGGGVRRGRVVVAVVVTGRPLAGRWIAVDRPSDAVLRDQQVEDRRDQVAVDPTGRHAAGQVVGSAVGGVEAREPDQHRLLGGVEQREQWVDVAEFEVPLADAGFAVAMPERAVGDDRLPGDRVDAARS